MKPFLACWSARFLLAGISVFVSFSFSISDSLAYGIQNDFDARTFGQAGADYFDRNSDLESSLRLLEMLAGPGSTELDEGLFSSARPIHVRRTANGQKFSPRGEFEKQNGILVSSRAIVSSEAIFQAVKRIHKRVPIVVLYENEVEIHDVIRFFRSERISTSNLRFFSAAHDSIWVRDFGPTVLDARNQHTLAILDSQYNSPGRVRDDQVPIVVAAISDLPMVESPLSIDGGNILVNGQDLLLTTDEMLLQNQQAHKEEVSRELKEAFGVSQVVFLEKLQGEPTGHVDMFATFVNKTTVIVGQYDRRMDFANAAILDRNANVLASVRVNGHPLKVLRAPMPTNRDGVWRTYLNVIYANGVVLVPSYRGQIEAELAKVKQTFAQAMPGWDIEEIEADDLIVQDGALHCAMLNLGGLPADRIGQKIQENDGEFISVKRKRRAR